VLDDYDALLGQDDAVFGAYDHVLGEDGAAPGDDDAVLGEDGAAPGEDTRAPAWNVSVLAANDAAAAANEGVLE
jgi:hypothetical protein